MRGAGPGWCEGHSGIRKSPEHGLSSNAVPGGVWQVGRGVAVKIGRSPMVNVLEETGN